MDDVWDDLRESTVIVGVSGGKDSAALSLALQERDIDHQRVFIDTGWEHPATIEYLRGPLTARVGPITEIKGEYDMLSLIRKKQAFPWRKGRFCTEELKTKPLKRYLDSLRGGPLWDAMPVVSATGIRADESKERANLPMWEYSPFFDIDVCRPILRWTEGDVIAIHQKHGLRPNPLYMLGCSRVGCWPCINAKKAEIRLLAITDPGRIDTIRALEAEVSKRDHPRTYFQSRSTRGGVEPVDSVVSWALSNAPELDEGDHPCMKWGMCE